MRRSSSPTSLSTLFLVECLGRTATTGESWPCALRTRRRWKSGYPPRYLHRPSSSNLGQWGSGSKFTRVSAYGSARGCLAGSRARCLRSTTATSAPGSTGAGQMEPCAPTPIISDSKAGEAYAGFGLRDLTADVNFSDLQQEPALSTGSRSSSSPFSLTADERALLKVLDCLRSGAFRSVGRSSLVSAGDRPPTALSGTRGLSVGSAAIRVQPRSQRHRLPMEAPQRSETF